MAEAIFLVYREPIILSVACPALYGGRGGTRTHTPIKGQHFKCCVYTIPPLAQLSSKGLVVSSKGYHNKSVVISEANQ